MPTASEFDARYRLLGVDPASPTCVYCGGPPTEWDHLMPMVVNGGWSGYFTEIANLVPACGKCNQSRGSKPVGQWMRSAAPQAPLVVFQRRRGMSHAAALAEVERRIAIIEEALRTQPPRRLVPLDDPDEIELERCRAEMNDLLRKSEVIATRLRQRYAEGMTADLPAAQQIG